MQIRILEKNNRSDLRKFKSLPFSLYKGNPYWVAPAPGEIERVMNPSRHPFYAHSEADFIIVENGREVLGRIAVLHNRNYCIYHHEETAFFYYFESIEDTQVAANLFDAAANWSQKRGLKTILGPRGFLRSNASGLLVEGFDAMPAMSIPYNFPYYGKLVESCGFCKAYDLYSGVLEKHPGNSIHKIAEKVLTRGHFNIVNFSNISEVAAWIPKIEDVHQASFANNPGFYPSTTEEFNLFTQDLLSIANPKYLKVILHNDMIAGFIVAYPDINKSFQRCGGHLFPFGWFLIMLERNHPTVIDINGVGLLPEYQGMGGNALLYSELDKVLSAPGLKRAEVVQVDERNFRSKSDMQNLGVTLTKTHRTFQKSLM